MSKPPLQIRKVEICLIAPGEMRKMLRYAAPHGKHYLPEAVEQILHRVGTALEEQYPEHDIRAVELGKARYNIIIEKKIESTPKQEASHVTELLPTERLS